MPHITKKMNILGLAASLFAAACTTGNIEEPGRESCAIAFTPQAESRTTINKVEDMSAFNVWGWHSDGATTTNIFDATLVSRDAGWNYTDGVRYWQTGKTYDFYALHPSAFPDGMTAAVSENGTITVTGFDCSATGADAIDLMTASNIGISYAAEQKPSPVALKFNHELARIVIVAKNHPGAQGIEGYKPTVHDAVLYGMYKTADLTANYQDNDNRIANWTIPSSGSGESATDKNNPLAKITNPIEVTNADGETIIEILVFPQSITAEYFLDLAFSTTEGENPTIKNFSVQLSSLPITEWIAGKQYRYSFTITPDDRILFDKPTVEKWDEAAGGIIIVD